MKFIFSKILIFTFIILSFDAFAGWHIVKSTTKNGLQNEENIWINDSIIKYSFANYSIIIDTKMENIIYESNNIRAYWSGSFKEFYEGLSQITPTISSKKVQKKMPKISIEILKSDEQKQEIILGSKCQKYLVLKEGKKVEEFYFTDSLKLFNTLDINKIQEIIASISIFFDDPLNYQSSEAYKYFIYNGLIMKSTNEFNSTEGDYVNEVLLYESIDIEPRIFEKTKSYILLSIGEIIQAQQQITKEENERNKF